MGETASDFLSTQLDLGLTLTTLITGTLLILTLVLQFRATQYVPGIYWLAVVLISVVGTAHKRRTHRRVARPRSR